MKMFLIGLVLFAAAIVNFVAKVVRLEEVGLWYPAQRPIRSMATAAVLLFGSAVLTFVLARSALHEQCDSSSNAS